MYVQYDKALSYKTKKYKNEETIITVDSPHHSALLITRNVNLDVLYNKIYRILH
jgi:hypothetical protein